MASTIQRSLTFSRSVPSWRDRLDFNVRLRYAFAEGTDLWLVYNEGLDTDPLRDVGGLRSPTSLARTVLLKYTHTVGF